MGLGLQNLLRNFPWAYKKALKINLHLSLSYEGNHQSLMSKFARSANHKVLVFTAKFSCRVKSGGQGKLYQIRQTSNWVPLRIKPKKEKKRKKEKIKNKKRILRKASGWWETSGLDPRIIRALSTYHQSSCFCFCYSQLPNVWQRSLC